MESPRKISAWRRFVFSLIPLVFILALCEGVARLLPPVSYEGEAAGFMGDSEGLFMEDPLLMWRVRPNLDRRYKTNSNGFRGPDIPVKKQPGEFRILVLGDSTSWGWGVGDDELYPAVLEKLLDERMDRKVTVVNASVPGFTSYQGKLVFEHEMKKYQPDLVITYFGVNDSSSRPGMARDADRKLPSPAMLGALKVLRKSKLYSDLRKLALKMQQRSAQESAVEQHSVSQRVSPSEFHRNLIEIDEIAKGIGAEVLHITPAWNFNDEIKNDILILVFSNKGVLAEYSKGGPMYQHSPEFDLPGLLRSSGEATQSLFLDYCHLSPKGHNLLATALADRIVEQFKK